MRLVRAQRGRSTSDARGRWRLSRRSAPCTGGRSHLFLFAVLHARQRLCLAAGGPSSPAPGLSGSARRRGRCTSRAERLRRKKRRGTAFTVPRSLPSRLGRSAGALTCSARPSSAARCFSPFPSRDARFFTGEFVRRSFLVRRTSAFRRDSALCLRIHCCKSAGCLADVARATRFSSTVVAPAYATASTSDSTASAPLVHPLVLVVPLVCHYRSPAAIFEFNDAAAGR